MVLDESNVGSQMPVLVPQAFNRVLYLCTWNGALLGGAEAGKGKEVERDATGLCFIQRTAKMHIATNSELPNSNVGAICDAGQDTQYGTSSHIHSC